MSPHAEHVVAEALAWVGAPYRHQGRRRGVGCDCLGLVIGVHAALCGPVAEASAYSPDWAEAGEGERLLDGLARYLRPKPEGEVAAGDVIVFRWRPHLPARHAAIAVGPDRFVHAYEGCAVTVSPLVPAWRRRIAALFIFPEISKDS